jgi:hypothetical protein
MTDAEKLATAIAALREIERGSRYTGRWIDQIDYSAPDGGSERDQVPDGYYDLDDTHTTASEASNPTDLDPTPDDAVHPCLWIGGEWLRPAEWEPYTPEEQIDWLDTITGMAQRALQAVED